MDLVVPLLAAMGALVVGTLVSSFFGADKCAAITKILASGTFVAAGILQGNWSAFGTTLVLALALSLVGDTMLVSKKKRIFLLGLLAFSIAHIAYSIAFIFLGVRWLWTAWFLIALLPVVVLVGRWLLPHTGRLRGPVQFYMALITVMAALAGGALGAGAPLRLLFAAGFFYLSDLAVARNRFIAPGLRNRLWGLPMYYAAQALFVLSL